MLRRSGGRKVHWTFRLSTLTLARGLQDFQQLRVQVFVGADDLVALQGVCAALEVADHAWVPFAQLNTYNILPADQPFMERLLQHGNQEKVTASPQAAGNLTPG
jgi:hypothetical protein